MAAPCPAFASQRCKATYVFVHVAVVVLMPEVALSACVNKYVYDSMCVWWADIGECVLNTPWMNCNCAKACNTSALCSPQPADTSCFCRSYARQGLCESDPATLAACPHTCRIRAEAPTCVTPVPAHNAAIEGGVKTTYRAFDILTQTCPLVARYPTSYQNAGGTGQRGCTLSGTWWKSRVAAKEEPICRLRRESYVTKRLGTPGTVTLSVMTSTKATSLISCHATCSNTPGCKYLAISTGVCHALQDSTGSDVITLPHLDVWDAS